MILRLTLALTLLAVPALAQPAPSQPSPAQPAAPADDMAAFEKELDALFSAGGLTADQAAQRASKVSPSVRRSAAQIEVAIAQAQAAELSRVPYVGGKLAYTRLSPIDVPVFGDPSTGTGFEFPVFLDQYVASASASINLSDYVVRYP